MTRVELDDLIGKWENAKVDFKRELWNVKSLDNIEDKNEKKEFQSIITLKKNELIKDIFALTNGDIYSTKETAYLIIGVDDKTKEIYGFDINTLAKDYSLEKFKKDLLQWLNNYAQPEFLRLEMEFVDEVLVISIPPRGSLISLSKDLKLKNKRGEYVDKKGITYYRIGEDIRVASTNVIKDFEKVFNSKSEIELPQKKDPKPLTTLPPKNPEFIGREKELNELKETLSQKDGVVSVVNGIGGVGKSELAYEYLHRYKDEYKKLAFIEISDAMSIEELFKSNFQDGLHLSKDDNFSTIMRRLQSFEKRNLLVVDNLSCQEDFEKIRVLNSNFEIVVTTRAKFDNSKPLNLKVLNDSEAKEMFLSIFNTVETIDDVLKYLDNHPLFIRLTAYSLKEEFLTLDDLKDEIKNNTLPEIDSTDDKTFKEHLQKRFDAHFTSTKDEQKELLQKLAILPAIEIDFEYLEIILKEKRLKANLQKLVSKGWLSKKENSYKLHQIIKMFILEEYSLEYAQTSYILKNIGEFLDPDNENNIVANRYQDFIPIIEELLKRYEDNKDEPIASVLDALTFLYYSLGDYGQSLKIQQKSYEIRKMLYSQESKEIAINLNLLGVIYESKGEYNKAEPLYKKALEIREKVLGEEHPETATSYDNLAGIYESKGKYDKAEPLYKKALSIREKVLKEEHPDSASSYNNLAGLYSSKGEYDKAEPLYKKALEIQKKLLGEEHPSTATSYNNLASLYNSKGEYDKAEPLYKKALEIQKKLLGEEHPNTTSIYNDLAGLYSSKGEYDKAEPLYKKDLEIYEKVLGEEHPGTATSYNNLAGLYESKGEYDKAEPLYKKALEIREKVLGEEHPDTATSYDNLGLFYKKRKQCAEAKEYLEKAIGAVEKLEYPHINLIELRRELKSVEKNIKRTTFKNKGRFCANMKK